jgi:hypothetical protein
VVWDGDDGAAYFEFNSQDRIARKAWVTDDVSIFEKLRQKIGI